MLKIIEWFKILVLKAIKASNKKVVKNSSRLKLMKFLKIWLSSKNIKKLLKIKKPVKTKRSKQFTFLSPKANITWEVKSIKLLFLLNYSYKK